MKQNHIFRNRKFRNKKKMSEREWNQVFSKDDSSNPPHLVLEKSSSIETILNALAIAGEDIESMANACCASIRRMAKEITNRRKA